MTRFASRRRTIAGGLVVLMTMAACHRARPDDLWELPTPKAALAGDPGDPTGVWQGDVSMGAIRLKVERERVTLALQCDSNGDKRAQAAAPVVFETAPEPRIVLREPLAGGDKECGFRFNANDALAYRTADGSALEVAFAGASVSRLARIAAP